MKQVSILISLCLLAGCSEANIEVATTPAEGNSNTREHHHVSTSDAAAEPAAAGQVTEFAEQQVTAAVIADRTFNAGESAKLEIPTMTCRMCFKKINKALSKVDGITAIELTPQKDDDKVNDPHVTVQFGASVNASNAVAALNAIGYPNASFGDAEVAVSED